MDDKKILTRGEFLTMVGSVLGAAVLTYIMSPHETIKSLQEEKGPTNVSYGGK